MRACVYLIDYLFVCLYDMIKDTAFLDTIEILKTNLVYNIHTLSLLFGKEHNGEAHSYSS